MNLKFYIFGTPRKFEIYPNDRIKIKYFKGFNSVSKENEKMIIQRFENGQVFYTYFRYNLVNHGFQDGAFFGMAVAFKGKYCVDVQKLYQLFASAYNDILQRSVLLRKPINKDQVYFPVASLKEIVNTEIKEIENNVCTKINDEFSDADFKPVTDNFKVGKERKTIKTLNINKGNAEILKALKRYNQIAVSNEYMESEIAEEDITLKIQTGKEKTEKEENGENESKPNDIKKEKIETVFDKWNIALSIIAVIMFISVIFIIIHKNL